MPEFGTTGAFFFKPGKVICKKCDARENSDYPHCFCDCNCHDYNKKELKN